MAKYVWRVVAVVTLLIVMAVAVRQSSAADCGFPPGSQDLFYNYYVGGGTPWPGVPAQLYLCPRPTPALVGHTYITYQPLLPHEFLYRHDRLYFTCHPDASITRTTIRWR